MIALPEDSKVRNVVFNLNESSASGPDGFTGTFIRFAGISLLRTSPD